MEPVCTAIEFKRGEDDVQSLMTEPLLLSYGGEDEECHQPKKSTPEAAESSNACFIVWGILVGFVIQVVSLGAYAFMLTQYGEDVASAKSTQEGENGWFFYGMLSILTQVDLVIYVVIWVAFTCTMTRNGMAFIRFQYQAPIPRRSVFVLGVMFLVGIVLGAFVAWTMIDVYLGFPIPFAPIAATVAVDLILCYMMVWCYDLGREGRRGVEQEIEEDSVSCC